MRSRVSGHSLAALALALLIHGIMALLILNVQSAPRLPGIPPIHVALVYETVESEAIIPDLVPEPAILPVRQEAADTIPVPPDGPAVTENTVSAQPAETPVSARSTSGPAEADMAVNEDAYILSPATQSVLRGLQCPGDPEAFARTGICPHGAGRHLQMVASDTRASDFYTIDVSAIRALFGVSPHFLAGQAVLENGIRQPSLSNAGSMRETLPPSMPDPAFGD